MDNRNGDKLRENTRQPDLSSKVSENPSSPPPTVPRPTGEGQTPRPRVDPMRRENRSIPIT